MKKLMVMSLLLSAYGAPIHATKIEGRDFPDSIQVNGKAFSLNGVGLRKKKKFGMNFDVYVGGLYLVNKSNDSKAIVASATPKILDLIFVRSVDRETLQEAWQESFKGSCKGDSCADDMTRLTAFNDSMRDVRADDRIRITFDKENVSVSVKAKKSANATVEGASFSKNLLDMFIGDNPPTPKLREGLLGVSPAEKK